MLVYIFWENEIHTNWKPVLSWRLNSSGVSICTSKIWMASWFIAPVHSFVHDGRGVKTFFIDVSNKMLFWAGCRWFPYSANIYPPFVKNKRSGGERYSIKPFRVRVCFFAIWNGKLITNGKLLSSSSYHMIGFLVMLDAFKTCWPSFRSASNLEMSEIMPSKSE